MKELKGPKFVTEHELETKEGQILPPFKPSEVNKDTRRRYIRVEITSPLYLQCIKSADGDFWAEGKAQQIRGSILNVSAGGVLVDLEDPVKQGDIVALRFNLQGDVALENVLGLIKRTEESEGKYLTGIEFIDRDQLTDKLSSAEIDMLSDELNGFEGNVRKVLTKYLSK